VGKNYTGVVLKSGNIKLGKGAMATLRPVGITCPKTCPLLGHGCYAQKFHMDIVSKNAPTSAHVFVRYMKDATDRWLVRNAQKPALLRFHTSGDVMLNDVVDHDYVSALTQWARVYIENAIPVINYTHVWKDVSTRVMQFFTRASTHSIAEAKQAIAEGWHVTMQIRKGDAMRIKQELKAEGMTGVHCPWQTNRIPCKRCGLCKVQGKIETIVLMEKH
jgi:hypothetical protein